MTDRPIDEIRFTDREVQKILQKAVEESPSKALASGKGLSLAELKTIGQEVGIDPARLEAEARALVQGRPPSGGILGPTHLHTARRVEGEIEPDDAPDVLAVIRREMGHPGEVSQIHDSLEWRMSGELGTRYVTVSPRDGATAIDASANLSQLNIVAYLPTGIMGTMGSVLGFVAAANEGNAIGMALAAAVLPTLFGVMRTIVGKVSNKESAKLHRVVGEVAQLVERRTEEDREADTALLPEDSSA